MAKSVKVDSIIADLASSVGSVARILDEDQIGIFEQSPNLLFKLVAEVVQDHNSADLTEDQQRDLDEAKEKILEIEEKFSTDEENMVLAHFQNAAEKIAATPKADRGTMAMDLQQEHTEALIALAAESVVKREKYETTIHELSNVRGSASVQAVKDRFKYDGKTKTGLSSSIAIPGNVFVVSDLLKRSNYKCHAILTAETELYIWPYGQSAEKHGPKLKRETWHKIGALKIGSPTALQACVYDTINRYSERSDLDSITERLENLIALDNLPDRVGGSRNVHHIVHATNDTEGYTRQVAYADLLKDFGGDLPFKLDEEPDEEPTE